MHNQTPDHQPYSRPNRDTHTASPERTLAQKVILGVWAMALTAAILAKFDGNGAPAAESATVSIALEAALTIGLVYLAVAATPFWRSFAWIALIASAIDGAIDLPRAVLEVHPAWFSAEIFFVALPAIVWLHKDRIASVFPRHNTTPEQQ